MHLKVEYSILTLSAQLFKKSQSFRQLSVEMTPAETIKY